MIEPLNRAPLHVRDTPARNPLERRAGSALSLPLGEIAGDLRPLAGTVRPRRATYELLVSNDTPLPLATFAYAVAGTPSNARMTWNAIVVPPYSAIAVALEIALPARGRALRVVAELHSKEAQLTLDAPPPGLSVRGLARRVAVAGSTLALACAAAASAALNRPEVYALAAPEAVRGGTPFNVAYAVGNESAASYVVETPDGLQVGRGRLARAAGAFTIALPPSAVSAGYDIRVTATGPLGSDERSTHLLALPALPHAFVASSGPHRAGARIAAFRLAGDAVRGGEAIIADYRTTARAGSVRLIDELGTVRAEALLNRTGRSILVAPYADVDQDMRVVVTTERGTARDEAALPVRVLSAEPAAVAAAGAVAAPATAAQDPGESEDSPPLAPAGASPIAVAPRTLAGGAIAVRILRHEPDLRVALFDAAGAELQSLAVPPDASTITLAAPAGTTTERASVIATFSKGFAQETFVRPVTLVPESAP